MAPSLYDLIGADTLTRVIESFYSRAFDDPILAHFFMGKDSSHLITQQIDFVTALLGGPQKYAGKPISKAHENLNIRSAHIKRRQMILFECMQEAGLKDDYIQEWLRREAELIPVVLKKRT